MILHGVNMVYKVGSYRPADAGFGADDAALPAPPRLQHRPARDHLQGARAEAARRSGKPALPPRLPPQHREHRARARRAGASSACSTSTRTSTTSASRARAGPTGRCSTTASRPSRRPGSRPTTSSTPGLNRAFDNFWANAPAEGRGLQDAYAAAWRRVADEVPTATPTWSATTCSTSPGPARPSRADDCFNTAGCPTFDAHDAGAVQRAGHRRDPRRRPRDPDLLRAAGHLRLRRRLQAPRHRRPGGRLLLPRLLPARVRSAARAPAPPASRSRTMVFANADKQSRRDRRRPVPDRVRRHRRPRDDRPHRPARRRPHDLLAVLALLRLRRPDHLGPRGPGARDRRRRKPPRGANVNREKLRVLARPYPRAVAGTPRSFGFDPATRALRARLLDAGAQAASRRRLDRASDDRGLPAAGPVPATATGSQVERREGRLGARRPGAEARAPPGRRRGQRRGRRRRALS